MLVLWWTSFQVMTLSRPVVADCPMVKTSLRSKATCSSRRTFWPSSQSGRNAVRDVLPYLAPGFGCSGCEKAKGKQLKSGSFMLCWLLLCMYFRSVEGCSNHGSLLRHFFSFVYFILLFFGYIWPWDPRVQYFPRVSCLLTQTVYSMCRVSLGGAQHSISLKGPSDLFISYFLDFCLDGSVLTTRKDLFNPRTNISMTNSPFQTHPLNACWKSVFNSDTSAVVKAR